MLELVTSQEPLPQEPPHIGPILEDLEDRSQHERYAPEELAIVLSHYDLGVIEQIRPYTRGSRRAPKLRIRYQTACPTRNRAANTMAVHMRSQDTPIRMSWPHGSVVRLNNSIKRRSSRPDGPGYASSEP